MLVFTLALIGLALFICQRLQESSAESRDPRSQDGPLSGNPWAITATRASVARAELHSDGFSVKRAMREDFPNG